MVMSNQLTIFDAIASREVRDAGIGLAVDNKASLVIKAREIAVEIARREGTVDMDRVTKELMAQGERSDCLGNAAGGVFRDKRFVWTGRFTKATRIQSHSNLLRVWSLSADTKNGVVIPR